MERRRKGKEMKESSVLSKWLGKKIRLIAWDTNVKRRGKKKKRTRARRERSYDSLLEIEVKRGKGKNPILQQSFFKGPEKRRRSALSFLREKEKKRSLSGEGGVSLQFSLKREE